MGSDAELMLIFAALHVVALALGGVLFAMFLRSETVTPWEPPDEEDGGSGGGGSDRLRDRPKRPSGGGVPLPDAAPARVRLRNHGRLAERYPRHSRRPEHPPAEPTRVPDRA